MKKADIDLGKLLDKTAVKNVVQWIEDIKTSSSGLAK